ncbi:Z1 domain-containing protein [Microbacterium sp. MC2]
MSQTPLSAELFRNGLLAFEGILAGQLGRSASAAEAEARKVMESMMPGFGLALDQYLADQRDIVETIKLGNLVKNDGGYTSWYSGPRIATGEWPQYKKVLSTKLPEAGVRGVDESTTRILSRCANPKEPGDRRKGLVIGYVQSGKTANYAGLIAKAVDAGYRIIIVLAGMYTNLRAQTQLRLEADLNVNDAKDKNGVAWSLLTGRDTDIAPSNSVGFMSSSTNVAIMVVKKHEKRLANVARFLRDIPDETLRSRAVLIVDDESDQATPNTLSDRELISTINKRVRDIWKEVPTGTYVAYTATPFANMFIDPNDPEDLYPEDFAMVLPRPDGYMGADSFFDVDQDADHDEDEPIYALSHVIDLAEAQALVPGKDIDDFHPEITPSLDDAIRWFILATAIRQIRTGKISHSSMLLHTSHRVTAHQRLKDAVASFTEDLALRRDAEEQAFRSVFVNEAGRAAHLRGQEQMPEWTAVWDQVREIIGRLTVKIDNGQSDDRLVYPDDSPQFVIAIGGGTLSRGLTLEGLVVSYFLRTSNTYDTLLQMGRWFGFRPRYQDLARVWVGPGLLEDYSHLARVEREIRAEVAVLEAEGKTPRELAIRVRTHPGRLQITSPGKMTNAMIVHAGLGGSRRQTIYLDRSAEGARNSQMAARRLIEAARSRGATHLVHDPLGKSSRDSQIFVGLTNDDVVDFLRHYWVVSDPWLQADMMATWLEKHGTNVTWNVVLVSGPRKRGTFAYAPGVEVGLVSRAPLQEKYWKPERLDGELPEGSDVVNIRALMSGTDSILDLEILAANDALVDPNELLQATDTSRIESVRATRKALAPDIGTILLYAVDRDSQPLAKSKTRRAMEAPEHLIGLGVIFPHAESEEQGEFVAADVQPPVVDDEPSETTGWQDTEGDYAHAEDE